MTRKITGPALIGFSDFFTTPADALEALDKMPEADVSVVGATKGKPPKVITYPKGVKNPAMEKQGKVMVTARKTAADAAKKTAAAAALLKKPVPTKPVHVGAAAAKVMTPKQKAAVQKHNAAAAKSAQATKTLGQHVMKAHGSVVNLARALVKQKQTSAAIRKPKFAAPKSAAQTRSAAISKLTAAAKARPAAHPAATARTALARPTLPAGKAAAALHIGALVDDPMIGAQVKRALRDYYAAVGCGPDLDNPGYLTDGSPDPAAVSIGADANGLLPGQPGYNAMTDPTSPSYSPPDPNNPGYLMNGQPDPAYGYSGGSYSTAPPDPNNPGFLMDGTPDPAYADPTAGLPPLTDDPLDSGVPLPPAPDMDYYVADMTTVGGIAYDGSKGTPEGFAGSYGLMTRKTDSYTVMDTAGIDGTDHFGFVWGKFHDKDQPNGIAFGDDLGQSQWNHVRGRHILGANEWWNRVELPEVLAGTPNKTNPVGISYGPIVGNPKMPDFARMRMDGAGNFFWFPQEAPDWLTFPLKQAAALTAQAAAKAAADAQAAQQAAMAKQQADAQAAQAAQDAANALAESQAQSQMNVQQMQAQAAQAQADADAEGPANQALIEQQQADTQEQQLEIEQARQAGQIMMQQAQMQQQLMQQHPELLLAALQAQLAQAQAPTADPSADGDASYGDDPGLPPGYMPDQGMGYPTDDGVTPYDDGTGDTAMPGMDAGGGEGQYDDGTVIPGADLMLDQDGEGFPG